MSHWGERNRAVVTAVGLVMLLAGCGSSGSSGPKPVQPSVNVVALGDSDADGSGDPSGRGWVGRYGDLLQAKLGFPVKVDNRAAGGKTSDGLLEEVTQDAELQQTLARADVILIGIGGADLNAGDEALRAGSCTGRNCYAGLLRRFDTNISSIASQIRRLAPSAVMRAINLPNVFPGGGAMIPPFITADISLFEVRSQGSSICRAMKANGGRCGDAVRAFNGPAADGDAYRTGLLTKDPCWLSQRKGSAADRSAADRHRGPWTARIALGSGVDRNREWVDGRFLAGRVQARAAGFRFSVCARSGGEVRTRDAARNRPLAAWPGGSRIASGVRRKTAKSTSEAAGGSRTRC